MAVCAVAASPVRAERSLRLVVLLAVLGMLGLAPASRPASAAGHGGLAQAVSQAAADQDCSVPPRIFRGVQPEQPAVSAVVPHAVILRRPCPVARVEDRAWRGSVGAWFAVSRAGRAPPFSSGI
ncbi:hypothetical protein ABGB12_12725 [Actinocorallia sp. B10E7]|uniref:hypothetical protein n=1 Tax=Actinocorallia sp. B10E7 TaxID=3153558 RepID=UPI00325E0F4E